MTTEDRVRKIIADVLMIEESEITLSKNLYEHLEADIFDLIEIVMGCETAFKIKADTKQIIVLEKTPTLRAITAFVDEEVAKRPELIDENLEDQAVLEAIRVLRHVRCIATPTLGTLPDCWNREPVREDMLVRLRALEAALRPLSNQIEDKPKPERERNPQPE
jgi:acyl carrier protein